MSRKALTVATFNIHHGRGRDGRVDLDRTATVIRSIRPDVIALQELDVDMERSNRIDQPRVLGEAIGMEVHFFPTLTVGDAQYGIGLAARDELWCNFEELPRVGSDERRIAVIARWRDLNVVTAHLSRMAEARALQTEALGKIAADLDGPAIVLGDLNQRGRELMSLTKLGFRRARPRTPLKWWLRPHPRVDHIFVRPPLSARRARLVPTRWSDHSAVVAEITGPDVVGELAEAR